MSDRDRPTTAFEARHRLDAGNRGFVLGLATSASAGGNVSATTATGSRYDGQLRVALHILPHCQFTNFGPECAGRLDGLLPSASGTVFALRLTNAAPRALAALAVGPRANLPIPLPGTRCQHLLPVHRYGDRREQHDDRGRDDQFDQRKSPGSAQSSETQWLRSLRANR